ncbi:hypothetical protein LP422_18635 [Janibacter limosus]|uniref:Uncharacterized protein n=1 Tax=Janibacter limosus TaxID=53458 RepID=A0AC61U329_9MICO|nr:hypothetical protein [Janibacter limosus]UUZ44413.1 hypothetical protein LP422_18635 [Janibacter limosus]
MSDDAGPINAVPVRHPGRWVALVVIAVFFAMIISSFVTNERWDWPFAFRVMNYSPVLEGLLKGTILATIGSMIIGVVLGVVVGVMRLSDNPVLKFVGFLYTWFFRGIPRLGARRALRHRHRLPLPEVRHRALPLQPAARRVAGDEQRPDALHLQRQPDQQHAHLGHHRDGPVRGGLHGRDRACRHHVGRQRPA